MSRTRWIVVSVLVACASCTGFTRPTPSLGAPCITDADCGAATCLDTPAGSVCTRTCDAPEDCPGGWVCGPDEHDELGVLAVCRCEDLSNESCNGRDDDCDGRIDETGASDLCGDGACVEGRCRSPLGGLCLTDVDCLEGGCVSNMCRFRCSTDRECPAGFECNGDGCECATRTGEMCNGRDDDCDGRIDEGGGIPLCGSGGECVEGACQCSRTELCGGRCADLIRDPENCGACGVSCGDNGWCELGRCSWEPRAVLEGTVVAMDERDGRVCWITDRDELECVLDEDPRRGPEQWPVPMHDHADRAVGATADGVCALWSFGDAWQLERVTAVTSGDRVGLDYAASCSSLAITQAHAFVGCDDGRVWRVIDWDVADVTPSVALGASLSSTRSGGVDWLVGSTPESLVAVAVSTSGTLFPPIVLATQSVDRVRAAGDSAYWIAHGDSTALRRSRLAAGSITDEVFRASGSGVGSPVIAWDADTSELFVLHRASASEARVARVQLVTREVVDLGISLPDAQDIAVAPRAFYVASQTYIYRFARWPESR